MATVYIMENESGKILHVDMDAFFVSVERVLNPRLNRKPVVVGGKADQRGVVASASYEARKFGIHSAMPMAKALRLCPNLIRLSGTHGVYKEFSDRIMSIFERFTPIVRPTSIDEAYLDMSGCTRVNKTGLLGVAQKIHDSIYSEVGVPCSIGIAGNKVTAKIASGLAKPHGMLSISPGREADFLAPLPVGKMPGIGPSAEAQLKKMGIRKVSDLASLDETVIKKAFGAWGAKVAAQARGDSPNRLSLKRAPVKSIGHELTYAVDSDDPEFVEATLSYLSERVGRRMLKSGVTYRRVTVKLRYADFNTVTRSRVLTAPSKDVAKIFSIAREMTKALTSARRVGIRLIGVSVSLLADEGGQLSLFSSANNARREAVSEGIEEARKRYGFESVMTARSLIHVARPRRVTLRGKS